MGKASGVLLLSAGLGLAAYAALPASKPPAPSTDDFDFRLSQPALSKPEPVHSTARLPAKAAPSQVAPFGSEAAPASAPAVVTVAPQHRPSPRLAINSLPKSGVPVDRSYLARELQKELRRVGCYDGEINGGWTTSTKRAMKTFTERVNASLPIEEPDLALLSLVQGQADKTCGRPCPAGESSDGGRCVPAGVASSPRKAAHSTGTSHEAPQPAIGLSTTAPTPSTGPAPEGRMGLAGPEDETLSAPRVAPAPLPRPPVAGSGYVAPEGRSAAPADRSPSRRLDAQTFFKRLDKQSAN